MDDKISGSIYTLAIGDAMGAPWEGWRPRDIASRFGSVTDMVQFGDSWQMGEFTDDTWLTLAAARAYDDTTFSPNKAALSMVTWQRAIGKGIGRLTNIALANLSSGRCDIYNSGEKALASVGNRGAANGSLMRCSPTGLVHSYSNIADIMKESKIISAITHADSRCIASCIGYNIVLAGILDDIDYIQSLKMAEKCIRLISTSTADIFNYVANGEGTRFDINLMSEIGFVHRALERALISCRDSTSLEGEMIKVVNEGGDTDTNAAIVGGLLGAKFGYSSIPDRWIKTLMSKDELDDAIDIITKYKANT